MIRWHVLIGDEADILICDSLEEAQAEVYWIEDAPVVEVTTTWALKWRGVDEDVNVGDYFSDRQRFPEHDEDWHPKREDAERFHTIEEAKALRTSMRCDDDIAIVRLTRRRRVGT